MAKLTPNQILALASKYETKAQFRTAEPGAYRRAHKLGILDQLGLQDARQRYDEMSLATIAAAYETRGEFRRENRAAYNAAVRLKILDKILEDVPK